MARKPAEAGNEPGDADKAVTAYTYPAKRKNIPPAGLESLGYIEEARRIRYEYNPHLPPVLRSSPDAAAADALPELLQKPLQDPLSRDEVRLLADALRKQKPWLEWSGKRRGSRSNTWSRISTSATGRTYSQSQTDRRFRGP